MTTYNNVPRVPGMESPEDEKRRFEIECEFVQSLANPNYVNFLAQRGYFKEEYFINYLKYLLYWKRPEYARALKYPQALHILEALQSPQFRDAMAAGSNAKFVEDQLMLQWQFYLRKRQRLCEDPNEETESQATEDPEERMEVDEPPKESEPAAKAPEESGAGAEAETEKKPEAEKEKEKEKDKELKEETPESSKSGNR
ncbi:unnamed protein product [Caenorhabditis auriculariae]|uniref:Mediator of RNA polymerase II transcription subunit 31 n=1 Tax=Caenorhabditis auriculariae TaxID=2777116 RepID=A0A8S1GND6_9PELO|nr:unnamed protein product [Caenorhabditis auriculariae]